MRLLAGPSNLSEALTGTGLLAPALARADHRVSYGQMGHLEDLALSEVLIGP